MKKFIYPLLLLTGVALLATSCKKEEATVGQNGLNPEYLLNSDAIDTFQLLTYSLVDDSLLSSNTGASLLGSYMDPEFGMVHASFYTQLRLSGLSPVFGNLNDIVIDSFVLGLEYKDYYGNLDAQQFEVYQLNEDLHPDTTYYSFQSKNTLAANLVMPGKGLLTPNPFENTVIDGQSVDPQLRLHLDTNLARTFMSEAANNPSTFESNENFLNYFKGLYITVNNIGQAPGKGAVFNFNINDPLSKLTVYYRLNGESKTFDYLINSECADFNKVITDNTGTDVLNVLNNPTAGSNTFYAQANNCRGVIEFPSLLDLPENTIIQYAILELPVSYYTGDLNYPSSSITVSTILEAGSEVLYSIGTNGTYSDNTKSYRIDIKDYLQRVVSRQVGNFGLQVAPSKMITSAERIIFNGSSSSLKQQPKLHLIYTTY